ncbi:MAG: hypothetical protein A3C13_02750 [Candidatus Lloydbacteria bacterium RIFCSPHIGHO2_02_FULL_50_11]|nr:MAG: hypothetical protein A3C13_02750 [Candidatus Lloydbacteria bacterium RIFCSPHIGHO2_02_FULL_50_11]
MNPVRDREYVPHLPSTKFYYVERGAREQVYSPVHGVRATTEKGTFTMHKISFFFKNLWSVLYQHE